MFSLRLLIRIDEPQLQHIEFKTDTFLLDAKTDNIGMDIPVNKWHKLESLEAGTMIFEVKDGPYHPLDKRNILQKSGSTY